MKNKSLLKIITCAMFAAIACIATMVIQIPSPMSGYVNLGDTVVLLGAFILGPVNGALAAGIGSALADLLAGYAHYVPGTFVIKALMALVAGWMFIKLKRNRPHLGLVVSGVVAEMIMVIGYFFYAMLLLGKGLSAAASIPGNIVQGVVGIIGSFVIFFLLEKVLKQRSANTFISEK